MSYVYQNLGLVLGQGMNNDLKHASNKVETNYVALFLSLLLIIYSVIVPNLNSEPKLYKVPNFP